MSRPAVVQAGAQGAIEVVLAIDTSGSMAGAPLAAAKSSALAFVQQLPAGARAAVIGFGNSPYVVSPMTDDRRALETAIAGLETGGETALYDAIGLAAAQFSLADSPRSMMLVSDGGDTVSARYLYAQEFEFVPQFKLVLVANHAPAIRAGDDAVWRRFLRAPFDNAVPEGAQDKNMKRILRDPAIAGPAILTWLVDGCQQWQATGLGVPATVSCATEELRSEMDHLAGC